MIIEIKSTGRAIPPRRVTNDELSKTLDTSDEWIRSHTGIGARHISDDKTATSDLAVEAARKALAMYASIDSDDDANIDEKALAEAALSIDMIVVATATPDYFGSPSTACLVQDRLGAKNAAAMDVTAGCSGFVYALETAAGLLAVSERKRLMLIGAETLTKFADWTDRGSCVLFGDGAGAMVLEKTSTEKSSTEKTSTEMTPGNSSRRGLIRTILKADGSGAEFIYFMGGGSRRPFKAGEVIEKPSLVSINGQAVYNFAVKAMVDLITEILMKENLTMDDIAIIIPHQANARIVQAAAKRLKIPEEKYYLNIEEYANSSAATIPIAMDELNRAGKLKKGDLILTVAFGAGLTCGINLIEW